LRQKIPPSHDNNINNNNNNKEMSSRTKRTSDNNDDDDDDDFALVGYRPSPTIIMSRRKQTQQNKNKQPLLNDNNNNTNNKNGKGIQVILQAPSMDDDFDLELLKFNKLSVSTMTEMDEDADDDDENDDNNNNKQTQKTSNKMIESKLAVENAKDEEEEYARLRKQRVQLAAQQRMQRIEEELRLTLIEEKSSHDRAMIKINAYQEALTQRDTDDANVLIKATEVRLMSAEKERKQNLENISQIVEDAKTEAQKQREEKDKLKKIETEQKFEQEKREIELRKQKEKIKEEEEAKALAEAKLREAEKVPAVYVTSEALEAEKKSLEVLHYARERIAAYSAAADMKRERRTIIQRLTVHVQQIACTKDQVLKKANDIISEFLTPATPDHIRTYAMITLSKKILAQCDVQVAKLNRYAFALAEVLARCAAHVPELGEIFVALLRDVCPLAVPKYYPFLKSKYEDEKEYFKICGFAPSEDDPNAFESSESYVNRISGYMLLYGAYVQVSRAIVQNHPHGIDQAWMWFARLLNKCPPNRQTAVALESFLKHCGYEFVRMYKSQGVKLLLVIAQQWIPKLENSRDADAVPVISRLRTYLNERKFEIVPEGSSMPKTDTSSTTF
jgi:nucleoporin GLE1